jgi:hypothetical protein
MGTDQLHVQISHNNDKHGSNKYLILKEMIIELFINVLGLSFRC